MDDEWYYFCNNHDMNAWEYLKVNKENPTNVRELAGIDKNKDTSLSFSMDGSLYIAILEWGENQYDCTYQIVNLMENGKTKEVISGESAGLPGLTFGEKYIIICTMDQAGKNDLKYYDMDTGKIKTIFSCKNGQNLDGSITGRIILGIDWPRRMPSNEGFCFVVSSMDETSINEAGTGENMVYYYSFDDKKVKKLTNNEYTVDYIGGFTGSGVLKDNRFIGYSYEGYDIFNLENRTYDGKKFPKTVDVNGTLEDTEDYPGRVTGFDFYDSAFYFSTWENDQFIVYKVE